MPITFTIGDCSYNTRANNSGSLAICAGILASSGSPVLVYKLSNDKISY